MKKLSKILCAVLVVAMLCSSLIFMVGAEEEEAAPAYTSVPASTDTTIATIKYSAEDNLISYLSRVSDSVNGWNGEGARQAHIVTNNKTGESWYREWFEGDRFLLNGDDVENKSGNEYIQFNFEKQTLLYEEGFNEYIIVDMDLAYSGKTATIWDRNKYTTTALMKQEVIGRSTAGTSWATTQYYKDFGLGGGFKHVTAVYDYTSGNAYIFANGELVVTYKNGALSAGVYTAYKSGTAVDVSEWRIGSNSADEFHMANAYVRYAKSASAEDGLAAAIKSGKLSAWSGNIYNDDYVVPTPYWFVKTAEHTELENWINQINTTTASVIDSSVEGNLYKGTNSSIGNGIDLLGVKTTSSDASYVTFYGTRDGSTNKKNIFWQFNTAGAPNVSVEAGTSAYYVVDLDLATHGEVLPYIDISVMLRRISDGSGFPFSVNIEVADYIDPNSAWNHFTIVGDIAANQCYVFVNGEYVANPGYAYKASELAGNTQLSPKGIRVDLGLSNASFDVVKGQNIAFDNFSQRVYTDAASANGLAEAIAAGSLNGWANHTNGNAGKKLPVIATVNGVPYSNSSELAKALISNDKLNVEYFSVPFVPATLLANATVQTNGFDVSSLFALDPNCTLVSSENGVLVTTAPYVENRVAEQAFTSGGYATSVYNAIKYDVEGNIFYRFGPVSLQVGGVYQPTWGQPGFRLGELVTNTDNGDVFYRESAVPLPDGTMADGVVLDAENNVIGFKEADKGSNTFVRSNEYSNCYFDTTKLTYEAGKNEYVVVDFDFGTDDVIKDPISVQLVPRVSGTGSGAWASDIYLENFPIAPGEMAHVTLVFDFTTNNAHVFVDGVFAYSIAEAAIDGDKSGGRNDGNKWKDMYLTGTTFNLSEFKICSDRRMSTICFDNVAIRAFDLAVAEDAIGAAVKAGDITTWAGSIYNDNYKTTKFPAVATVDGVDAGSVAELNALLAVETENVKEVCIKHTPDSTIKVLTDANVETNGLACDFDYKTGTYEFIHDDPYYVCTGTNIAKASNRLILAHEENSTVYSFETINKDNCAQYATPVLWFISLDPEEVEVVFYVYGDQITPFNDEAYIEDGKLHCNEWYTLSQDFEIGEAVSAFPVSGKDCSEAWYFRGSTTVDADFAADDIKQNANISTSGKLNIYVNKSETITDGKVVEIDGVEYLEFTFDFAPYQIAENFVVEFEVVDENGRVYTQKQNVSFVDYANTLLAGDQSDELKELVVSMLKYANEAHLLKMDSTIASVDALLDTYADRIPTEVQTNVYNTDELSSVIRSAAMKLNSIPEFVFKVARGFKGTIEFSYTGINGTTLISETVDATAEEQLIVLKSFGVADIFEDITITATSENGTTVTGKYNLSSYAAGLDSNAAFANALLAYAQTAKKYIANNVRPTYDADGNVIKYEILSAGDVTNTALTTVVTNKIKQWDQSDAHNVHTGTPVYAKVARDNKLVEALYFSKTTPWVGDEGEQFSEYRLAVNGEKAGPAVTGISFWYLADGTVETNTKHVFTDLKGNKFYADAYVQIKTPSNHPLAGDNYPELSGTDFILDGEWHHMNITFEEPIVIIDILFNLHHFQGEFVISDLAINFAE